MRLSFTLTELLVVIIVIVIILSMAVPAINSMIIDSHQFKTYSSLQSSLQLAGLLSASDHSMYAVRVSPVKWILDNMSYNNTDGQAIVLYQWVCSTDDKYDISKVKFDEHLERYNEFEIIELSSDSGVVPLRSLLDNSILDGSLGFFSYDCNDPDFLSGDDILYVFMNGEIHHEPPHDAGGLIWPIRIFDYGSFIAGVGDEGYEAPRTGEYEWFFRRHLYYGAIIYRRDALIELGSMASSQSRLEVIQQGMSYWIHPYKSTLKTLQE